jgi:hypothetical protein
MKENDVVAVASLLGKEQKEVVDALENGGIDGWINDFKTGNKIMTTADFDQREKNLKEVLVGEIAAGEKVPQLIYNRVKGDVLEMTEKNLAKQYNVESFDNFDDLIGKLVTKTKNPTDTESELKNQITKLTEAHEESLKTERSKNDKRFVNLRLREAVNGLDIDAEGDKLNTQRDIVQTMFEANHKFEVNDDKVVVLKRNGEEWDVVKDSKLDPIPVASVLEEYATSVINLKSSGSGGRGDSSSTSGTKSISASKYLKDKGIHENSLQWATDLKKFKEEGYEILQ